MAPGQVAVIGAGSYFFGKPVIHKMATSPIMAGGTLALVDTNPKALNTMMKLARRVFNKTRMNFYTFGKPGCILGITKECKKLGLREK